MAFTVGIVLFAVGILFAVCLHEAGHMLTAKWFGMRVTKYFAGFGPTIWSFKRGETEYGVKALPFGGFVKIVGMTPQEDEIDPTTGKSGADDPRAMWRFPVWKRTIVMSAGSITHFTLTLITLWVLFSFVGIPDLSRQDELPVRVGPVAPCISTTWEYDAKTKAPKACDPATAPKSPASQLDLKTGDIITSVDGVATPNSDTLREQLKKVVNKDVAVTWTRDGKAFSGTTRIPEAQRIKANVAADKTLDKITADDLEQGGLLGISIDLRTTDLPKVSYGPVDGVGKTFTLTGSLIERTFASFKDIPEKVPNLFHAILGEKRDPETPVSVVGASRIGGELFELGDWASLLLLFASLNLFFGIFNLFPLLPMDGGHIAIAWFERVRSWAATRLGKPDPGRVDYYKLAPLTLGVIGILGVFVLLTVTADVVNPISLK
ncbi:M50 family metallopeptidase [Dactylosporangium siamense]|uniref:Zn-dependent protease n=1 Tax=Dactylosporangium siamense TaxID=685454 RepID=A0A919PJH8_9ACTN|nr:site-2 protease family protein [Dactylosporangium siamense]GIG44376.1 Zn-dependent protease [Dactylosporangium siamense]